MVAFAVPVVVVQVEKELYSLDEVSLVLSPLTYLPGIHAFVQ